MSDMYEMSDMYDEMMFMLSERQSASVYRYLLPCLTALLDPMLAPISPY